jgi:hypothetical protein
MEDHVEDQKKAHRERRAGKLFCSTQYCKTIVFNDGWKIIRAQSGQEKFKDPHVQEMDEKSFCYPVSSQGSETFSQVNRFGSAQINQILHEISFIAEQNLFPTLVSNFLFFFFFRARKWKSSIDRTTLEPPPIMVAIVGPPKVGKKTLYSKL